MPQTEEIMRRQVIGILVLIAIPLFAAGSSAYRHRDHSWGSNHGMSISVDDWSDDGPVTCDALKVTFDDEPAARAEEDLPVANLRSLRVRSDQNGGVHVVVWSEPRFSVKVCKAAAFPEQLGGVKASLSGNTVSSSGPSDEGNWTAYFIVRVPPGAQIHLETHNGGIGLHHIVEGNVKARAVNGPISIKDSNGTFDAETTNGPISVAGDSGNMKLNAQNGPISVKLSGTDWRGSLEALTQNGPLAVKIGRNFRSGVVIDSDGRRPRARRAGG